VGVRPGSSRSGGSNFTVTFQAADQTLVQVVARINQFAGFPFAATSGEQLQACGNGKVNRQEGQESSRVDPHPQGTGWQLQ
jgi:hypothetical protein